jgi:hypothetical protein
VAELEVVLVVVEGEEVVVVVVAAAAAAVVVQPLARVQLRAVDEATAAASVVRGIQVVEEWEGPVRGKEVVRQGIYAVAVGSDVVVVDDDDVVGDDDVAVDVLGR